MHILTLCYNDLNVYGSIYDHDLFVLKFLFYYDMLQWVFGLLLRLSPTSLWRTKRVWCWWDGRAVSPVPGLGFRSTQGHLHLYGKQIYWGRVLGLWLLMFVFSAFLLVGLVNYLSVFLCNLCLRAEISFKENVWCKIACKSYHSFTATYFVSWKVKKHSDVYYNNDNINNS